MSDDCIDIHALNLDYTTNQIMMNITEQIDTTYIDQVIMGSFYGIATRITSLADIEKITPADMRDEVRNSWDGKSVYEPVIYYADWHYIGDSEATHFILFPEAGRGGVATNGLTEWFDANDMNELETAYFEANNLS
jgi:hypothetical protein